MTAGSTTLGHILAQLAALALEEQALARDAYLDRAEIRALTACAWRRVALATDLPTDDARQLLVLAADVAAVHFDDTALACWAMADSPS